MTWVTGVAAGYIDFLDQLQAQLCNRGHAFGLSYAGAGNGTLTGPTGISGGYLGGANSVAETFTITATDANTFDVVGSLAGNVGQATVGQAFTVNRVSFRINAGLTPFQAGDEFKLSTTPPWQLLRRFGAVPSARFSNGFDIPANLWNGVLTNYATAAALPANAGIGMIGPAKVLRVGISVANNTNFSPTAFRVEYSDDGAAWSLAKAFAGEAWTVDQTRVFTVDDVGEHKHWRVVFTASVATQVRIVQVRFYRDAAGDIELQQRPEFLVAAPGNDGTDAILIGFEVYEDAVAASRSLNAYQFRSLAGTTQLRNQAANSGLRNIPLTSNNFTWWLSINGRRFTGVAKIGAVYVPFYQGLGKPYELPSVHPYPAINAGTSNDPAGVATSTSPNFRGFSSPGRYGMTVRYPDGAWRVHSNRYELGSGDVGDDATPGKVYPAAMDASGVMPLYRESIDGSRPLFEMVLFSENPAHTWGELDGCYFTPGFNLVPEVNVRMDGFDHMVFQNTFRNAASDFFAIRQD